MKWLKEVQKGCSDKYLFYFTVWPLGQLDFQWSQPGCIFFSFGLMLVHVGVPTFVCNREVLNWDFSADSGIQCLSAYLMRILIRLVRAGHVFFFKTSQQIITS